MKRRDCPRLEGENWCIDFFWVQARLLMFLAFYNVFDLLETAGWLSLRYTVFDVFLCTMVSFYIIKCYN